MNNPYFIVFDRSLTFRNIRFPILLLQYDCVYTGINGVKENDEGVRVYPNPNNGSFTLSLSNITQKCNVEIYNMLGEQVLIETLRSTQGDNLINLSGKPNGVYLYRVLKEDGGLVGEVKVVIEK